MWVTVILMAIVAALDPMRVAALVVILARRQPVRHLVAYLIGGFGVSLFVGAVVLFVLDGVRHLARLEIRIVIIGPRMSFRSYDEQFVFVALPGPQCGSATTTGCRWRSGLCATVYVGS